MKFIRKHFLRWLYKQPVHAWLPPYAYLEMAVTHDLHSILRADPKEVGAIVVVGACYGHEVENFRRTYPNSTFTLLEGSPKYADKLVARFADDPGVTVHPCLASDVDGEVDFYEGNLGGTGSILPASAFGEALWGLKNTSQHRVASRRLDSLMPDMAVDLLWMDVQGGELKVLQGATGLLSRTNAVFCEVSLVENIYEGAPALSEIEAFLGDSGFVLTGLGLEPVSNSGNALFVRTELARQVPSRRPAPVAD